jgi:hypothetical protein
VLANLMPGLPAFNHRAATGHPQIATNPVT